MKKHIILSLAFCFLLFSGKLWAQNHKCYTEKYVQTIDSLQPGFIDMLKGNFNNMFNLIPLHDPGEVFNIQVVVHIVYNTEAENLPDSLIHSQIQVLNESYRRRNADAAQTLRVFQPVAADAGIQFSLATIDPDGKPCTGITRTKTFRNTFMNLSSMDSIDNVKFNDRGGKDAWPTREYMNIWVCNLDNIFIPLLGYSYPPVGSVEWSKGKFSDPIQKDGVVISFRSFGKNNPQASNTRDSTSYVPYNLGKTTVHESGHYFGLQHIWGSTKSCDSDDGFADTPDTDVSSNGGCDTLRASCNDSLPDMVQNYMDYSCDACANLFTRDQSSLMRQILRTSRAGLHHAYNANHPPEGMADLVRIKTRGMGATIPANPLSNKLKIQEIQLYSAYGEIIESFQIKKALFCQKLDFSDLEPDTYWLLLKINDRMITQKMVISP